MRRRLHAEIVAIGTELLLGDSVDTNSAWLSRRLTELGIAVTRHTSVDDDVARMLSVLGEASQRADAVLVTGGLGPTQDDLTRQAVARLAGVPLERRDALVDHVTTHFARSGRRMPPSNLVQADLPRGARVLRPHGTAAGFAVDLGRCAVYCLPGVPREMRAMADADVFPELAERAGLGTTVSRVVRTAGMSESHVAELLADTVEELEADDRASIAFLASRGETRVRVTATAASRQEALGLIDPVVERIVELLGAGVAGLDEEGPEHAVLRQLRQLGWTLGVAESMTGGGLAARLTRVPGASAVFRGGIVTYATDVKATLAGVDPALLEAHGPVSEQAATALARGARSRLGADVGVGVVGVAGPRAQGGKPVGLVHLAVVTPAGDVARQLDITRRSREDVQDFAVSYALDFVRRRLAEDAVGAA